MKRLCLFALLITTNACFASQLDAEEKTDEMFTRWVKPSHPVQVTTNLSDKTLEMLLTLLARGYAETGPCMGPYASRARETLVGINMPTVLTDMVIEYFVPRKAHEHMKEALQANWWALFEKYVGAHIKEKKLYIDARGLYEIIVRQQRYLIPGRVTLQSILKTFLNDLQELEEIGYARNPYGFTTKFSPINKRSCKTCYTTLMPHYEVNSYTDSISYNNYPPDLGFPPPPDLPEPNASTNIPCHSCKTINHFVLCTQQVIQLPQLLMHITRQYKTVNEYIEFSHVRNNFSLAGTYMLHKYTVRGDSSYDNDNNNDGLGTAYVGYTRQDLMVHLRDTQSKSGTPTDTYKTPDRSSSAEDSFKSQGGTIETYAILYAQTQRAPERFQRLQRHCCRCVIL